MVQFPAPVGGTVLPNDFAPSILFAILYAFLVPLMLYRVLNRRSRCVVLIGTIIFSVERVVIFSFRAVQAKDESRRFSHGLTTYQQISFGLGFIGIASDAVKLARCLLVNATFGPEKYSESPAYKTKDAAMPPPTADTPDHPRMRTFFRQIDTFLGLAFLGAVVPGIIANLKYSKVFESQTNANTTATNRMASAAVAVALSLVVVFLFLWGLVKLPRVCKRGVVVLGAIYTFMIMIGVYRILVMRAKTTSLSAPSVLNTPLSKAGFYVFHVLPEWLASVVLFGINIRKTFGTGLIGDYRSWDETEKERTKRLEREAKREAKRQAKQKDLSEKTQLKGP